MRKTKSWRAGSRRSARAWIGGTLAPISTGCPNLSPARLTGPTVGHRAHANGVAAVEHAHLSLHRAGIARAGRIHRALTAAAVDAPHRARPLAVDAVARRAAVWTAM